MAIRSRDIDEAGTAQNRCQNLDPSRSGYDHVTFQPFHYAQRAFSKGFSYGRTVGCAGILWSRLTAGSAGKTRSASLAGIRGVKKLRACGRGGL